MGRTEALREIERELTEVEAIARAMASSGTISRRISGLTRAVRLLYEIEKERSDGDGDDDGPGSP